MKVDGGIEAIITQQKEDLVGYLTRVKSLPAPTRDLVFMHSEAGVASGLEAATSDRLAAMARNGQTDGLDQLLGGLPAVQQQAAVENLARWSGSFAFVIEKVNAITVLLAATAVVGELSPEVTALVAGAVLSAPGEMPAGALGDVIRLAQRCRGFQRRQLIARLESRDDVVSDSSARAALIESFPEFTDADSLYGEAMGMAIGQIDEDATKNLLLLPEAEQARLLVLADPMIEGWIRAAREKAENPSEGEEPGDTSSVNYWLLPALQATEASRVAITRFAIWLLRAGNPTSDSEVQKRLELLAPVDNSELLGLMLERMQTLPLTERERWLEAVEPTAIDADGVGPLGAVTQQLWRERTSPEADPSAFISSLDRLGDLSRALPSEEREFPGVEQEIDAATEAPMHDEAAAQDRLRISGIAEEFVDRELADTTRCANSFIMSVASAMGALLPGEQAQLPELRGAVRHLLANWLHDASAEALRSLRDAATQNPEAPLDPTKAEALLGATGRLAEVGDGVSLPIAPEAIGGLAQTYGAEADGAVTAWLTYFASENDLWQVLAPMWGLQLSPAVRQGFGAAAKKLSPQKHHELAEAAFDQSLNNGPPPSTNWEAIALRELSGSWVVGVLADRRPGEDLERWRILLEIARQRVLSGRSKPLVANQLLRPLIEIGSDPAVELALDNLELAGKRSSEEMIQNLSLTGSQARLVEARLKQLGWRKGGLSGFLQGLIGEQATDEEES